jgi:hypothetical protein
MTRNTFKKRLCQLGFTYTSGPFGSRFSRTYDGKSQFASLDNVMGGDWRLFLAVGEVPGCWPADDVSILRENRKWVEAESPWFKYFTDLDPADPTTAQFDDRNSALQKCFDWLTTVGIEWLDGPDKKSRDDWRKEHNVLIR